MGSLVLNEIPNSDNLSIITKGADIEASLQQCLVNYKELLCELNQMQSEFISNKTELLTQKQQCESNNCSSSEKLKKVIESKDTIIQLAASAVTIFNETKNHSFISDILKILCGDMTTLSPLQKTEHLKLENNTVQQVDTELKGVKKELPSPKKVLDMSIDEESFKNESVLEIEGTPGRTSPVIHPKKLKSSSSVTSLSGNLSELREKKKCPSDWSASESKQVKLYFTKTSGQSRQAKLCFKESKPSGVVDLTCSPAFSGGARSSPKVDTPFVQMIMKKEPSENDDTILPSPTSSGVLPNSLLSRTTSKDSSKPKKQLSLLKAKTEQEDAASSPVIQFVTPKLKDFMKGEDLEDSINILKPNRSKKNSLSSMIPQKPSPRKQIKAEKLMIRIESAAAQSVSPKKSNNEVKDEDMTHCEDASMSILQHVNKLNEKDVKRSPAKRPLVENINCTNVQTKCAADSGISLPHPEAMTGKPVVDNVKRKPESVEPLYKEPTVRKKADKMVLPGWCCDDCKAFFGNLYADDVDKIKAVVDRCSKHRGRNNPVRPKTPPGFWYPRWSVPDNTEEFNKRNNAE